MIQVEPDRVQIVLPNSLNRLSGVSARVLVVDDLLSSVSLIRDHLRPEGIESLQVGGGIEALDWARAWAPDLILIDLDQPGYDGFELLARLQDDPRTQAVPVIFLSGHCSTGERAAALDQGAVDFVAKPFDPVELRARVRVALRTKHIQDLLEQRAHLDGLTGLGNRHALERRLASDWETCRRRVSPLTVLIADLDKFKRINDEHGHPAGDELLRRAALTLQSSVRAGDFVARFGGEEFVVVAPDCDLDGGLHMAERFRREMADLWIDFQGSRLAVTTSVGVASVDDPTIEDRDAILRRADRALYEAKTAGRNAVWAWSTEQGRPSSAHALRLGSGR